MEKWNEADSLFAPLIVGAPRRPDWPGFGNVLLAASACVPQAEFAYKVKGGHEYRDRSLLNQTGEDAKPFSVGVACVDVPRDRPVSNLSGVRHWHAGITVLKDGLLTPAIPADYESALFQVSRFRLTHQGIVAAPQLALLRHLWVEMLQSFLPGLVVFGGQHGWDDTWWTEKLPDQEEAS